MERMDNTLMSILFCDVVLFRNTRAVNSLYTYKVPTHFYDTIKEGMRVFVPFGKGNKKEQALVISLKDTCDYDYHKIKDVVSIIDDGIVLNDKSIRAILWMNRRFVSSYAETVMTFLPAGILNNAVSDKVNVFANLTMDMKEAIKKIPVRNVAQHRVINYLSEKGTSSLSDIYSNCNTTKKSVHKLEQMGMIELSTKNVFRKPTHYHAPDKGDIVLSDEQMAVYNGLEMGNNKYFVHGVTGSGKTEIYLKWVKDVVQSGKQAVILVPEIALTTQIVSRFLHNFGNDMAVFHSGFSMGERYDQWKAVAEHRCNVILGTRSALFAPFDNLGIIILDEAHDDSYKSANSPRYDAREVAKYLSNMHHCPLVLGSATMDMISANAIEKGEYKKLELLVRHHNKSLPNIRIIDMRDELKTGNFTVFSRPLYEGIIDRLENNQQSILFLNRKGYATFVSCRSCGFSLKCPHCEISLTYYHGIQKVSCNYCGYSINVPKKCPSCDSKYFKYFGTGTEKLELLAKEHFPNARIDRLDRDVVRKKGQLNKIINKFASGQTDILIGTQMITKGFDFNNVTLVGCISADSMLNLPDFRSSERTFQTLMQVAGRAGRGDVEGEVLIQTYMPEHFALSHLKNYAQNEFINDEMELRKKYLYPPFCRLSIISIVGVDELIVQKMSSKLAYGIKKFIVTKKLKSMQLLGPNPAIYSKIRGEYKWQILLKSSYDDTDIIIDMLNRIKNSKRIMDGCRLMIDVDAISLL